MSTNPFNEIYNAIRYRFNLDDDKAKEDDVVENIRKGVEFKGINLWTLIFAILIASIGLNVNSTAVIIGAMLVSPLMGPIMGIGLAAGIYDFALIKKAAKNLIISTLIGLLTSTIYFFLSPLHEAQSELLARTSPTIWDVLIAFFGGLAGIMASSRKKYNNVIPGVAIATALMPPLCTAGYGIATAQWTYFFGAFYLYVINSVFISISTFLVVRFLKYSTVSFVDDGTAIKVKRWIGIIAICTIIPSVYLAYQFVKVEIFEQNANKFINDEIMNSGATVINKNISASKNEISLLFIGERNIDSIKQVLEVRKLKYNLDNTILVLKNNGYTGENEKTLNQLKEGLIENMFLKQEELIKVKSDEVRILKEAQENQLAFDLKKEEAINEFYALYGIPKELIIERTILHEESLKNDTILMIYINTKGKSLSRNKSQINNWLKTKFSIDKTKIVID